MADSEDLPNIINPNWEKWYDFDGNLHREDGPAKISRAGYKINYKKWFEHGVLHREDAPAVIGDDGSEKWFCEGQLHRTDGPAITHGDGSKEYWINGRHHREDGPAVETQYLEAWIENGKLHRKNGPALIRFRSWQQPDPYVKIFMPSRIPFRDAKEAWFIEGKCHREGAPAIKRQDETEIWVRQDSYHREEGPAVTYPGGSKEWWNNDRLHRDDGPAVIVREGHFIFYLQSPTRENDPRPELTSERNHLSRKVAVELPVSKIHDSHTTSSQRGNVVTERELYHYLGLGKRLFSNEHWVKGEFVSRELTPKEMHQYEDPDNQHLRVKSERTFEIDKN